MQHYFDPPSRMGIAGGTLLGILANISSADIVKTTVLAATGAAVSFVMTLCCKHLVRRIRKK